MSNKNDVLDDTFAGRINSKVKSKFARKCKKLKTAPGPMIREMIEAFTEDRLTIQPTEQEKALYK